MPQTGIGQAYFKANTSKVDISYFLFFFLQKNSFETGLIILKQFSKLNNLFLY